jgi:ATP-dependent RNA helicase RhlB
MKKVIKKVASWLTGKLGRKKKSPQKPSVHPPIKKETGHRPYQGKHPRPLHQRKEHPRRTHPRQQRSHKELLETRPLAHWDASRFVVQPVEGKTRFHDLSLPNEIMHAIADLNFQYCTPVQAEVLPRALEGKDCTGRAQTGTGKTAAFLIAILSHFLRKPLTERRKASPRALILAPTRELVLQIEKDAKALSSYMRCKTVAVFGGMNYERQKRWLDAQVDIVVATPGRLIDFKNQNRIHLNHVEILVIDEADRMLDMGFIPDIRKIVLSTPHKEKRQTMFFTATFTDDVRRLAGSWTREAHNVDIEPEQVSVKAIDQKVYITTTDEKLKLLFNMIAHENLERVIVFGNRRDETQRLAEQLMSRGITCGLLSGDVSQHERVKTLEGFREGKFRVLVATDVAARGLHIEGVSHVVNYNLPLDAEDYVHRIGRTGRAGASGTSVSFACEEDGTQIPVIEEFIGRKLECTYPPDEWLKELPHPFAEVPKIRLEAKKKYSDRSRFRRGGNRRGGDHRPRREGGGAR